VHWLSAISPLDLGISTLVLGEIERGIVRLPDGAQRRSLLDWAANGMPQLFAGRMLPVDADVARTWGQLTAEGQRQGRPLPVVDGLMLATAAVHRLTLVSRNVADVSQRGIPVFDPFTGTLHR
jgi:predicted nucleic acid-binding protein